jgi:hypothetical protein
MSEFMDHTVGATGLQGPHETQTMIEGGSMNGAESLVRTLVASGIDTYFANPGTTEKRMQQSGSRSSSDTTLIK